MRIPPVKIKDILKGAVYVLVFFAFLFYIMGEPMSGDIFKFVLQTVAIGSLIFYLFFG